MKSYGMDQKNTTKLHIFPVCHMTCVNVWGFGRGGGGGGGGEIGPALQEGLWPFFL